MGKNTVRNRKRVRQMRRELRKREERRLMDPETALAIVDDDLPDGAYWAMLEELTGMEPGDFADF